MYLSRKCGGRGMKSIEREYKNTTIKTAAKLFSYPDPAMAAVRSFEAKAVQSGRYSSIKDAQTYARELGLQLKLDFPDPVCYTTDGHEVRGAKIKNCLSKAHQQELRDKVEGEKWQGKLTKSRWEDDSLKAEECFACLHHWKTAPTHTIVGAHELYQQLLPTRIFYSRNTETTTTGDERCRLCGKGPESVQHILAGCSALAQTKYLERHNNVLEILFFEVLGEI